MLNASTRIALPLNLHLMVANIQVADFGLAVRMDVHDTHVSAFQVWTQSMTLGLCVNL